MYLTFFLELLETTVLILAARTDARQVARKRADMKCKTQSIENSYIRIYEWLSLSKTRKKRLKGHACVVEPRKRNFNLSSPFYQLAMRRASSASTAPNLPTPPT